MIWVALYLGCAVISVTYADSVLACILFLLLAISTAIGAMRA